MRAGTRMRSRCCLAPAQGIRRCGCLWVSADPAGPGSPVRPLLGPGWAREAAWRRELVLSGGHRAAACGGWEGDAVLERGVQE